jgi:RHS repeat-associated protein
MSDANGQKVETSVGRYLPYGGWRTEPTADLTDRAFTGQKENMDIGLYYYNARYYAPGTGRFISADTIVPDPTNPQQFNRYTYVLNNPLVFTDPSGHCVERQCEAWRSRWQYGQSQEAALTVAKGEWLSLENVPTGEYGFPEINLSGAALVGWGIASQSTIGLAELTNWLDGGTIQLTQRWPKFNNLQGTTIQQGQLTRARVVPVEGVPKMARVFAAGSYVLIGGELIYDLHSLDELYTTGGINEQQYYFHTDATIGKAGFNTTMTTAGLISTPMGGVAIGGTQTLMSITISDPAVTAGQMWAIVRVGRITFDNGVTTTGTEMLLREIFRPH